MTGAEQARSVRPESETPDALTRVAILRRLVDASLERVWENVLDWEHLPWLHRSSFSEIECLDAGAWGWSARTLGTNGRENGLELLVERDLGRYVSRTTSGRGAGTEIWTRLTPRAANATGIEVEFWCPNVDEGRARRLGESFLELYTRLWDEDEAMMREREAQLASRTAGAFPSEREIPLGPIDTVRENLPALVELGGRRYRVVEVNGRLIAHSTVCPHQLGPLAGDDGDDEGHGKAPVPHGEVRCPWHGYRFDVQTSACVQHPGLRLARAPTVFVDEASSEVVLRLED